MCTTRTVSVSVDYFCPFLLAKVRRLYDIANVLTSLGLITKVHVTEERGRKPAFKWIGPVEFPGETGNLCILHLLSFFFDSHFPSGERLVLCVKNNPAFILYPMIISCWTFALIDSRAETLERYWKILCLAVIFILTSIAVWVIEQWQIVSTSPKLGPLISWIAKISVILSQLDRIVVFLFVRELTKVKHSCFLHTFPCVKGLSAEKEAVGQSISLRCWCFV